MSSRPKLAAAARIARTVLGAAVAPFFWLGVVSAARPLPPELGRPGAYEASVRITDRQGVLLREVRANDATRARWIGLDDAGDHVARAFVAAEDKRFFSHPGVDPLRIATAAAGDARERRVVSGASTITMQVARLARPHPRTLLGKIGEAAMALRIEATLPKRVILEEYVNRAPFGDGVRGVDAASRYYFDKPPKALSLAEAATLAGIPRGPAVYDVRKHPDRVLRRRDRVLDRMLAAGFIGREEHDRAIREPLTPQLRRGSFGAPHLVEALYEGTASPHVPPLRGAADVVETTLSSELQSEAEHVVASIVRSLGDRHVTAASVVVLENETGEVLAWVGSPRWDDARALGQNDGVRARRQPGSALKPFVYGVAMERLDLGPSSVLPDVELTLKTDGLVWTPHDYDRRFHGPVRLREALGSSLNVPAVWAANEVGPDRVLERLRDLGMTTLEENAEHYGPGIALGDGEVRLVDLANAYATLARRGVVRPVRPIRAARSAGKGDVELRWPAERRALPEWEADLLTDVLADDRARVGAFGERSSLDLPFPVAAKTGTSKGFRDNWAVGYTREVTVAVWVGNFDGSAMEGVSGITGAGPIFQAVMAAAMRGRTPARFERGADVEEVTVCPLSGMAPGPGCPHAVRELVRRGAHGHGETCIMHELARIDETNGLRAGAGCRDHVVVRSFERFDPPYVAWARSAARPTAPERWSPRCPGGGEAGLRAGVTMRYPVDGTRFVLDDSRPLALQTVPVAADAPAGARVALLVDGVRVALADDRGELRWRPARGEHVLVVEAQGVGASAPVRVTVD